MNIDLFFIDSIRSIRGNFLDTLFTNYFIEKSLYIWIILIIVLLCIKKTRKLGIVVGISFLITLILGEGILKHLVGRERPFVTYGYEVIGKIPTSFSFPSGNAALAFAVFGAFLFSKNKYSIFIGIFTLIAAFSRIYIGVHYFTDVLGGMTLGLLSAYFSVKISPEIFKKLNI